MRSDIYKITWINLPEITDTIAKPSNPRTVKNMLSLLDQCDSVDFIKSGYFGRYHILFYDEKMNVRIRLTIESYFINMTNVSYVKQNEYVIHIYNTSLFNFIDNMSFENCLYLPDFRNCLI